MSKIISVRLTLAAFIFSIELDLKSIIQNYIVPFQKNLNFLNSPERLENLKIKFNKENPDLQIDNNIEEAINFLDFQETFETILSNRGQFPDEIYKELKSLASKLIEITPIRNRVMHTRPLLAGDFSTIYSFVTELKVNSNIKWFNTIKTKEEIEKDPSYVLTLTIPSYSFFDSDIYNNLPIPDFDETGFIGRKKDVDDIKKLILSNNRVVSIIGDGGIGKTALIIKVAYDILDMEDKCPFDMIIWITAKTSMLTISGIETIQNTLHDYSGVVDTIYNNLDNTAITFEEKIKDIFEYFETFNVLLIIDNLETILDEKIIEFIREAQIKCKIAITSRIGLGQLEYPRKLDGLSETESIMLIKQIANLRNSKILMRMENKKLIEITKKLHYNPLALKWFVNSVETGNTPDDVINKKDDLLNFCLSNVYNKLSKDSILILNTILGARRRLNYAQLNFLTELPNINLKKAINELSTTTLINREIETRFETQEILFNVNDFAKEYLLKNHPLNADFVIEINKKLTELNRSLENLNQTNEKNEFRLNSIVIRNSNEKVVARLLTEALAYSKKQLFEEAIQKIDEARSIAPDYFEIYRISAFIKATNSDLLGAESDYNTALELEQDNPRVLLFYGQFLLFKLEDIYKALSISEKLYKIKPNSPAPVLFVARCYVAHKKYEDALVVLDKVLENKELISIDTRNINAEVINVYGKYALEKISNEGDYKGAIVLLKKAYILFEKCIEENNIDLTIFKEFALTLLIFVSKIPILYAKDECDYIEELIKKYDNQLSTCSLKAPILRHLKENYEIDLSTQYLQGDYLENKKTGIIIQCVKGRSYVFIETKKDKYYAGKKDFLNVKDWEEIRDNQVAYFDIGRNKMGECAINIIIKK
jgi:LuxR family transcriptional regulator, glucitol operon activator